MITRGERRRAWTVEQKREIARESLAPGASVAAVARKHEIPTGLLYTWRKRLQRGELGGEPRFLWVVSSNEGGEPREVLPATGYPWRSVSQDTPGSAGLSRSSCRAGCRVAVNYETVPAGESRAYDCC